MEKYQRMVFDRIEKAVALWKDKGDVPEVELYRFFHNLKGTAGTVGMQKIHDLAEVQMRELREQSGRVCTPSEWQRLLAPLLPYVQESTVLMEAVEEAAVQEADQKDTPLLLVIDDDVEFVTYMKDMLEENGYQALIAMTGEKGVELYYEFTPRLIILDYYLPDGDGVHLLSQMIEKAKQEFTPVVMLSAYAETMERIRAYELGAMDFISKPVNRELFFPFLKNRLAMQERVWNSSLEDELTGVKNRKYITQELASLNGSVERGEIECYSLVLCDLDYFKKVNDTYGHVAGDKALRYFAQTAESVCRPGDTVSRYGGEEFVLLLPGADEEAAADVTERLRETLSAAHVPGVEELHLRFSAGIRETRTEKHDRELLEEADQALYAAKRAGRNQTVLYRPDMEKVRELSTVHVIVIDDDPIVREMLRQYWMRRSTIGQRPLAFHAFEDGAAFLEADWFQEEDYYFLLVDGMMPKVDGIEVLREVRKGYPKDRILVSMLTARSGEQEVARALQTGADDYMLKPFRVREVAARMERLIERVF
ncbi:GGDEF domain-containing response regulator [Alkalicoccus urumqiensis]|uniref:GGDEF domain-containing response regulator n=1 Tax=Alkalicoccus urumqiensis TaxID=1548213 RepID=UPI0015E606C3|nr:diguanylate cyclase [Alkalicoccus urumqiensis]